MLRGVLSPGKLSVAVQSINVDIRCLEADLKAREQEELEQRMYDLEQALQLKQSGGGYSRGA